MVLGKKGGYFRSGMGPKSPRDGQKIPCRLFGLMLYIPVNSYGHVEIVSSPNNTFFRA